MQLGVCPPQERARLVPLDVNASTRRAGGRPAFQAGGGLQNLIFPSGFSVNISYDQFSDWIIPCDPAAQSLADTLHGPVVPVGPLTVLS